LPVFLRFFTQLINRFEKKHNRLASSVAYSGEWESFPHFSPTKAGTKRSKNNGQGTSEIFGDRFQHCALVGEK